MSRLADVPLTEEVEGPWDEFRTPIDEEQRVQVRYKLGSGQVRSDKMTPFDKADSEKQKLILREAVVANIVIGNKRRVCEEKGIPVEVFERVWDEYRETNTFHGSFFHRLEIPRKEKDNVVRMKAAIAEYHANGKRTRASMDDKLFSIFLDWFGNALKENGFSGQHILFLDNHDSHERSEPITVAMKHGIILITFPSHCTHLVQMLDLSFFKPLKSHWKSVSRKWCDEECTDAKPYISKPIF